MAPHQVGMNSGSEDEEPTVHEASTLGSLSLDLRRRMHIAMVAPPWFTLPPTSYGGIEAVVADLVDALEERGHEVTLIGAGEQLTKATRFFSTYEEPPSSRLGEGFPEVVHAAAAASYLAEVNPDVVHDHTFAGPLLARGRSIPTLMTAHGTVTGEPGRYLGLLSQSVGLVAISEAQRRLAPNLNWVSRVHNALRVSTYPFSSEKADYVLWMGRFSPDKGPDLAITAARAAGLRIVLAGKCNEPQEKAYFDAAVAPKLGGDAEYVGEADASLKRDLFKNARCLVFPIRWEEPFGMVMIEAMACGTPVIAIGRGSVPEIIRNGVTGLVVTSPEELPSAIASSMTISPHACRAHVEARFDVSVMAQGYEAAYLDMVERRHIPSAFQKASNRPISLEDDDRHTGAAAYFG